MLCCVARTKLFDIPVRHHKPARALRFIRLDLKPSERIRGASSASDDQHRKDLPYRSNNRGIPIVFNFKYRNNIFME